jgi:predicted DNA-binding antitoxin AbrB/MazE fold protein
MPPVVSWFSEVIPMSRNLKAVYKNGVLRPLEPVPFRENEVVNLTVSDLPPVPDELLDTDFLRHCETLADERVTIEQVRAALSKIPGSMAEDITKDRDDRV